MGLYKDANVQAAQDMQANAQAFTRKMMKSKFQWEAEDLEAAGLNRILGYASGAPSIGGSPMAAPMVGGGLSNVAGSARGVAEAGMKLGKYTPEKKILKEQARGATHAANSAKYIEDTNKWDADFARMRRDTAGYDFDIRSRVQSGLLAKNAVTADFWDSPRGRDMTRVQAFSDLLGSSAQAFRDVGVGAGSAIGGIAGAVGRAIAPKRR